MPDTLTTTPSTPTWPLAIAAVMAVALVVATIGLWAHYGTAVFFEIVAAGIAACF